MKRRALITGITGQDGSYLAELLLEKGYEVHGLVRRVAIEDPEHRLWRIRHLLNDVVLDPASLENYPSIFRVMVAVKPDEVYHLAAQSLSATALRMNSPPSTRTSTGQRVVDERAPTISALDEAAGLPIADIAGVTVDEHRAERTRRLALSLLSSLLTRPLALLIP